MKKKNYPYPNMPHPHIDSNQNKNAYRNINVGQQIWQHL